MENTQEEKVDVIVDATTEDAQIIAAMKAKHPEITHLIEVDGYKAYLKKIDRITLELALGKMQKLGGEPEFIRAGEIVLLNCWVAGDDIIKNDDDLLMAAALKYNTLLETKSASVKKI